MKPDEFQRVVALISSLGATPFFGTLLGMVRDNGFVEGDDDLDFIVSNLMLDDLVKVLASQGITTIDDQTAIRSDGQIGILRLDGKSLGITTRIDLFPFLEESGHAVFIQHWASDIEDPNTYLRVPLSLVSAASQVSVSAPADSRAALTLEFLYGPNWRVPQRKNVDYKVKVMGGTPTYTSIPRLLRPVHRAIIWSSGFPEGSLIYSATQKAYRLTRKFRGLS